ncbi:hypothetical protein ACG0Z6_02010 [Roseateles sp. BYS180W]|uniref:Cytochrome oxidase subunit II copper A binding domain-containing protein n=1 Tax=Roseateles rivi TaxID=3299028 RepID=A0ABW7FRR2_9BURK
MQDLAAGVSALLMGFVLFVYLWVVKNSGSTADAKAVNQASYRWRARTFWAALTLAPVLTAATLLPWPHDVSAQEGHVVQVHATAKQWFWELSTQQAKVGDTVVFHVRAADVNHGFALYDENQRLVAQIQAMPGVVNSVRHHFTKPGTYKILCLEYCGVAHHGMVADFTVAAAQ